MWFGIWSTNIYIYNCSMYYNGWKVQHKESEDADNSHKLKAGEMYKQTCQIFDLEKYELEMLSWGGTTFAYNLQGKKWERSTKERVGRSNMVENTTEA